MPCLSPTHMTCPMLTQRAQNIISTRKFYFELYSKRQTTYFRIANYKSQLWLLVVFAANLQWIFNSVSESWRRNFACTVMKLLASVLLGRKIESLWSYFKVCFCVAWDGSFNIIMRMWSEIKSNSVSYERFCMNFKMHPLFFRTGQAVNYSNTALIKFNYRLN